jgi:hypothetical protein
MAVPLPAELLDADRRLHAVHEAIRFSQHLNPTNIHEARAAFLAGAEAPPFSYAPATWATEARQEIDRLVVPRAHPLGFELAAAAAETRALIDALDRRDAASFEALGALCDWLPEPGEGAELLPSPTPLVSAEIGPERMFTTLREALRQRGLASWEMSWDPVLASRVLVDSARRSVRVNPAARFRETDRAALVAHEIDVHARRGANGEAQSLRLFATGLARSLLTEEGLAIVAEERVRALSPGFLTRQALMLRAVRGARVLGFRELWEDLRPLVGASAAFQIGLRVKRGLAQPELPGVYAKDSVYGRGYLRVRAWLAEGGALGHLYVGKVGTHHPVGDWLRAGWVTAGQVPHMWVAAA